MQLHYLVMLFLFVLHLLTMRLNLVTFANLPDLFYHICLLLDLFVPFEITHADILDGVSLPTLEGYIGTWTQYIKSLQVAIQLIPQANALFQCLLLLPITVILQVAIISR